MKPKFASGDKVFAKVRGYPPWPARVEGLADETPNKMRYHIFFYGTGETAVVKAEDICSFVENKARLGKPKKPKNFQEALFQIEEDLSPEEKKALEELEQNNKVESSSSNNVSVDDSSKKASSASKTKSSLSPTPKSKAKDKKRKLDNDSGSDDPENKKRLSTMSNSDTESSATKSSEFLSRSGRKIKPKRFADFEDESSEEQPPISKPVSKVAPLTKKNTEEHDEDEVVVAHVNGEKIYIPLDLNRPDFNSQNEEDDWTVKVTDYAVSLKKRLESGDVLPVPVEVLMDEWTRDQARIWNDNHEVVRPQEETRRNDHLKVEANLLELDLNIRSALNIKNADTERCILLLDKLKTLNLTALMLKKHPDVVHTIKKVRRYIGNVPRALTPEEERKFHENTEIIRTKAEHIYHKFQALFTVPSNKSFWDVFEEQRELFEQNTKHLNGEEVVSLVEEP